MSTKKIQKNPKKLFFSIIIFISSFLKCFSALAWNGYDYDNKSAIEIGEGNLVREGYVIQFYDEKANKYYSAEVISLDESASGAMLRVMDLDSNKERNFLME